MIPFQFRTWYRLVTGRAPVEARGVKGKLRRWAFFLLFPMFELVNITLLTLDPVFFRFKDIPVKDPIFIISSPRSGSTLLHRIMARDGERFTAFRLWQAIFPNLITQRFVRWIGRVDARRGGALARALDTLQDRRMAGADRFHKIRLTEVEEDEVLFLHIAASELFGNALPVHEALIEYRGFDRLPDARRHALMNYYRQCVQRHLWIEGPERRLLSKNPPFCHKVASLNETFPDARFLMLVRNPVESVCSLLSMLSSFRSGQGIEAVGDPPAVRDNEAVNFSLDCYRHALDALEKLPPDRTLILRYEDLVASPRAVVEQIYAKFGITVSPAFAEALQAEQERASRYVSRHHYSPERFGITAAQIEERAAFVYERFGYPRVGQDPMARSGA